MADFSHAELEHSLVVITSLIEKSEKAKINLTKGHLTLIENRIKTLRIASALIAKALEK